MAPTPPRDSFVAGFSSDYGRFFLHWYSSVLLGHGDIILEKAADVFAGQDQARCQGTVTPKTPKPLQFKIK